MKGMLRGKQKSFIMAVIAIAIILAVGVSFCAWDDISIIELGLANKISDYYIKSYTLATDVNKNKSADVGDTVYFGNYYQDANQTTKSQIEWIVVDIRKENNKDVLYLLSKYVMASGPMYASYYTQQNGTSVVDPIDNVRYNQCYNESTARAWLNSQARRDSLSSTGFDTINEKRVVMNGFYNEAFNNSEKGAIVERNLGSMKGYSAYNNRNETFFTYPELTNEKVWIPSVMEITGLRTIGVDKVATNDSVLDRQFAYFAGSTTGVKADKTDFAKLPYASYNNENAYHEFNAKYNIWLLRTPSPKNTSAGSNFAPMQNLCLGIDEYNEVSNGYNTGHGYLSVRPGVCVYK